MKTSLVKYATALALGATLLIPIRADAHGAIVHTKDQVRYSITLLGTLGGTYSDVNGMNEKLQVAGDAKLPGDKVVHAALWSGHTIVDLGTLGGPNSIGGDVNESSAVTVQAETSTMDPFNEDWCAYGDGLTCRMFVWHEGHKTILPTLGGNNSGAEGFNDFGQVAGFSETSRPDARCVAPQVLSIQAVVWDKNAKAHLLPPLSGDAFAGAFGINDRGDVVGLSGITCQLNTVAARHAVMWRHDGTLIDLGNIGGAYSNFPEKVNNREQVVGFADVRGDATAHAFFWQDGVMRDLGTLRGDASSAAFNINDAGQVTGTSCDASSNCRAILWQDGVLTDLNTVISPRLGLQLLYSSGITEDGVVDGDAYDSRTGQVRGYIAVPLNREAISAQIPQRGRASPGRIDLPAKVRSWLRQRVGFRRAGARIF